MTHLEVTVVIALVLAAFLAVAVLFDEWDRLNDPDEQEDP
jgi:hypothetical protein